MTRLHARSTSLTEGAACAPGAEAFGFTVLALCVTSCVGGVATFVYLGFFADASHYVFHGGGTARVFLDGHPVATFAAPAGSSPARDVRLLRLPRGPHQLAIEHDRGAVQTWTIDANGLDDLLVPTDPSTCFASIEVSRALYGVEGTFTPPTSADPCGFDAELAASVIDIGYGGIPSHVRRPLCRSARTAQGNTGRGCSVDLRVRRAW